MRKTTVSMSITLLLLLSFCTAFAAAHEPDDLRRSTVKLYTVIKKSNFYEPWQLYSQYNSGGSGCILEDRRILTNAHVVSDQIYIQVLKANDTRKYTASVEHVAHDSELALLRVEDPDFWKETAPIKFGDLPRQREKVAVYGFPIGGEELSVTEGVVSRVEVGKYVHSLRDLLLVQTDAAINPGNSGGPVFQNGRLVGVAFQSYSGSNVEKTGYMVPVPLISRFLKDVEDGTYDGIPDLGIRWQKLESGSLKAFYGLTREQSGILVTGIVFGSPAEDLLQEGDVLTSLSGVRIADDGTIPLRDGERVNFRHALTPFHLGDTLRLGLLRSGKALEGQVKLRRVCSLIAGPEYDKRPTYFIYAGIVFTPLSFNYLSAWEPKDVDPRFKYLYDWGLPSASRREVVIIKDVLPHAINVGYHKLKGAIVERINGVSIGEMRDVVKALEKAQGEFHVIELDHRAGTRMESDHSRDAGTRLVIRASGAPEATLQILTRYDIPADRSADLK
ncbi:MAG: trypsin-like peptidase domain-containing protein [Deltaproteobacteria bacterium]|nr:trypsin-like peptidase domain-containing protein [Deltaproteobacteria bacterium]